jgi:hypothetical protein
MRIFNLLTDQSRMAKNYYALVFEDDEVVRKISSRQKLDC